MKLISGGVTAPKGFLANGLHCGIRKSGKKDLALVYSETICDAAGVFTTNAVQASCVVLNKKLLAHGKAQAIVANSGNANCMTGTRGFRDSKTMVDSVARALSIPDAAVCVASTGIIGKPLPIKRIKRAFPRLIDGLSRKGSRSAALGIMTTDTVAKEVAAECSIDGKTVRIGAIAKGAGMIHPHMSLGAKHATMLCFVTTDAKIAPRALRAALAGAVEKTFNLITIDGDMSTNDMVLILANGMAGNKTIAAGSKEFQIFCRALGALFLTLAKKMVHDAEGATKFVEVVVKGAKSAQDARTVARAIGSSNLVKCALFGSDPNWGRIAAAAGYSGAKVNPWKMRIYLGNQLVLKNGGNAVKNQRALDRMCAQKEIRITVDLGLGREHAVGYTCDLSTDYVKFNSAYHT